MADLKPIKKMKVTEKLALIDKVASAINKKEGKTIVGRIGESPEIAQRLAVKWIPTPSPDLNEMVGGGFPRRRCTIISGEEDSGKTSLVLETIGENMKKDPDFVAIWIESENSLGEDYIINTFHIDPQRFVFIPVDTTVPAEKIMDMLYMFLKTGTIDLVCINSLKMLVPTQEAEASLGDALVGVQARFNSRITRKFTPIVAEYETAFIIITHLSTMIGTMKRDPLIIAGGKAIKYWSALTLDLRKQGVSDKDLITKEEGVKIKVSVRKNHVCPNEFPYRQMEYYAIFGEGIEVMFSTLAAAINKGICKASGAWVYWLDESGEERMKWNGRSVFRQYMKDNPDIFEEFTSLVYGGTQLSDEDINLIKELDAQIDAEEEKEKKGSKKKKGA